MPLDPSDSEVNVKLSLIKYFTDTVQAEDGLIVRFSAGLKPVGDEQQWVAVQFGGLFNFTVYPCIRNDPEGIGLSGLRDTLRMRLEDIDAYDKRRSIPIYDTTKDPWVIVNHLKIITIMDENEHEDDDGTRYKIISVRGWFPQK